MIKLDDSWRSDWSKFAAKVGEFLRTETILVEMYEKRIHELLLERLQYEAMAFKYFRSIQANAKGMKRQAAKIKRLESKILDLEFTNQYLGGEQVNKVEVNHE